MCPTYKPTKEILQNVEFVDYVREIFKKNPNLPMFKIVPPKGYRAHQGAYDLNKVMINTPIRQHAFGRGGAFVCILEEQEAMEAAEFKAMATAPGARPPARGHDDDDLLERAFWSSLTFNPPLYGADNPTSLFDKKVAWGWNLRHLNCLFREYKVPPITGVTTPMVYLGSWRSFFGWHKEDCDLLSTNYLHFGAPKVWYCVAPGDGPRFDAMARQLFPDAAAACPAFMRHKNYMMSPKVLRDWGVPFVQAKQRPGEFVVLNAGAYHAGFNLGFNAAEAVNFAVPEWMEVGRECEQCECGALPDGVQLDMSIFFPGMYDSTDSEEDSDDEDSDDEVSDDEVSDDEVSDDEDSDDEDSEEEEDDDEAAVVSAAKRRRTERGRAADKEGDGEAEPRKPRAGKAPPLPTLRRAISLPPGAAHVNWGPVADAGPMALVRKDPDTRERSFELVHRLNKKGTKAGGVWIGTLRRDGDGLWRPAGGPVQEQMGWLFPRLVHVRTEWTPAQGRRRGGWKLTTKPERILM